MHSKLYPVNFCICHSTFYGILADAELNACYVHKFIIILYYHVFDIFWLENSELNSSLLYWERNCYVA